MRLIGRAVTPEFFAVFNASPALGRFFNADDRESVVLSYGMWQTQFGGDASAVGRSITFDDKPYRIVGVAPADFHYPADAQAFVPLLISPQRFAEGHGNNMNLTLLARLRAGVTPLAAVTRVHRFSAAQQAADTAEGRDMAKFGYGLDLQPFADFLAGDLRSPLWMLWAAALVVLLTGCANVAGLLLTRSSARRKEIAIRLSLGATRWQIVRQLAAGEPAIGRGRRTGGPGHGQTRGLLVTRVSVPGKQLLALVTLDERMLVYGLALAMASGLLFGLVPAVQLLRESQTSEMARSRRRWFQDRVRHRRSGRRVRAGGDDRTAAAQPVDGGADSAGFRRRTTSPRRISPSRTTIRPSPRVWRRRCRTLRAWNRRRWPIRCRSATGGLTSGFGIRNREQQPGEPELHGEAYFVTPEYFRTLRIPLFAGRNLAVTDNAGAPLVCLIDRNLADRFFPNQNPIGQEIAMYKGWAQIVGVTAAVRADGLEEETRPVVYYSLAQIPFFAQSAAVVRSAVPAAALIRDTVRRTNSTVPVYDVQTMEERMGEKLGIRRVLAALLAIFGAISLLLATIGIYGVIAQVVAERTQEIGVRMALGARPAQILRQFMAQGLRAAGLGLALGTLVTLYVQKWISGLLYQVKALDAGTIGISLAATLLVLLLAVWWPARRASRISPQTALRYE